MATIAGPSVKMPEAGLPVQEQNGALSLAWGPFFNALQQIAIGATRSGPTASRPTSALQGRWIGMMYFDTTLGIAIWLSSVNPDVWVRYDGTAV